MRDLAILLLALCVALAGCDQDPFGFTTRPIAGEYGLNQFEESFYYLVDHRGVNGVGILEGGVEKLGWNDRYILAWRDASFNGARDGWMIVDSRTHRVTGPFSDADLERHPEVRGIEPVLPYVAWKRLGGWPVFIRGFVLPMAAFAAIVAVRWLQRRRARASANA